MLDIEIPLFTINEAARAAEVERSLLNVWMQRGVITPTRVDKSGARERTLFSVADIFRVKLARILRSQLGLGPNDSDEVSKATMSISFAAAAGIDDALRGDPRSGALDKLTKVIADPTWMWAIARSIERDKPPLPLVCGISRADDCWTVLVDLKPEKLVERFGADATYSIFPMWKIFDEVYTACRTIYEGDDPPKVRRRARKA